MFGVLLFGPVFVLEDMWQSPCQSEEFLCQVYVSASSMKIQHVRERTRCKVKINVPPGTFCSLQCYSGAVWVKTFRPNVISIPYHHISAKVFPQGAVYHLRYSMYMFGLVLLPCVVRSWTPASLQQLFWVMLFPGTVTCSEIHSLTWFRIVFDARNIFNVLLVFR